MNIAELCEILNAGTDSITLVRKPRTKMPRGWPRGELLCVNYADDLVYSYNAARVRKWAVSNGLAVVDETTGLIVATMEDV